MTHPRRTEAEARWLARGRVAAFVVGLVALLPVAAAQDAPAPPPAPPSGGGGPPAGSPPTPPRGTERESMWRAPTAEDWAKPCLLTWQRTWDDAVAVSKATGKPILVCINMDGEIASEHYAGVRYRQPEIAALYAPYVLVIASVYRHNPRDYDDQGRRIPCPRFGGVTCGEHIALEPVVYDKFLDGQRVAPRHIAVDLDGKEVYDVYYANDTKSVFDRIQAGVPNLPPPPPEVKGDRPIAERATSPDVRDRVAVEAAFQAADPAGRRRLLDAALAAGVTKQLDLLRLSIFGLDPELAKSARAALAKVDDPAATDLVLEALRVPMEGAERDALIAALGRMGATSPRASWLAAVHQGLAGAPTSVDPKAWGDAAKSGARPATGTGFYGEDLANARESQVTASRARPDDPAVQLDLAEASLGVAMNADKTYPTDPRKARFLAGRMFADARRAALEAKRLGSKDWRVDTILALAAYHTGDLTEAYARAEAAVPAIPPGEGGWSSMAVVTVFAESRFKQIAAALKARKRWPPSWLADLNASYAVLIKHPLGTETQVLWYYDFLVWLGADDASLRVLSQGVERFAGSATLHARYLDRVLKDRGPEGAEAAYAALLARPDAPPGLAAKAAAASVAAADHLRRAGKIAASVDAYTRAVAFFDRAVAADPLGRAPLDDAAALALAGRGRAHYQLGDDAAATDDVFASLARSPDTAGTRDALGITPGETAQMLRARLVEKKQDDLLKKLDAALAPIDPELLRFDRE